MCARTLLGGNLAGDPTMKFELVTKTRVSNYSKYLQPYSLNFNAKYTYSGIY